MRLAVCLDGIVLHSHKSELTKKTNEEAGVSSKVYFWSSARSSIGCREDVDGSVVARSGSFALECVVDEERLHLEYRIRRTK